MPSPRLALAIHFAALSFAASGCNDPALIDQGAGLQYQKQATATTINLSGVGPGSGIGSTDVFAENTGPGEHVVLRYDASAKTWSPSNLRAPNSGCITCKTPSAAVAASFNYAAGAAGHVERYDAASGGWIMESTGLTDDILALWGDPSGFLVVVGAHGGISARSIAGDWKVQKSPTTHALRAVFGGSPANVFGAGEGGAVVHFDGTTWTLEETGSQVGLKDVWGSAALGLFAAGDLGTILHRQTF